MTALADIRDILFRHRGYTPVPFVVLIVLFARPTAASFAAGLAIALFGEMLRLWGVSIVGAETRVTGGVGASQLVTSGPYARVRNPLYAGNMLIYLGMGIASNAWSPWLQAAGMAWFLFQYSVIVHREEEFLFERFGDRYARYAAAVPRFLPTLRRYEGCGDQPAPDWGMAIRSDRRTLQAIALLASALAVRGMLWR
jgi:protein-S-isoprenylcysteine O-methyltransferase Ste14